MWTENVDMWQKTAMNIDVEKFAIGCFRNWNTSWTGSVLFQMPIENASQKTYQVGNKNDTIGKWLNCLLQVKKTDIQFQSNEGTRHENFTATSIIVLSSKTLLPACWGHWLFLFTASNWKGMRNSNFIHNVDRYTAETKLLSFGHLQW